MAIKPVVIHDPDAMAITIQVIDDTSGAPIGGYNAISISLVDLANLGTKQDGKTRVASFKWLGWKDSGCTKMRALVLMTAPEPDLT